MPFVALPVIAENRAAQLMDIAAIDDSALLSNSVRNLTGDVGTVSTLVRVVTNWGGSQSNRNLAVRALRVLQAAKAPEAVELLLSGGTARLLDDPPTGEETISQQNHIKQLISLGEPSVRVVLSLRHMSGERIDAERLREYCAILVGVDGADGARTAVLSALTEATDDTQRNNLTALRDLIESESSRP